MTEVNNALQCGALVALKNQGLNLKSAIVFTCVLQQTSEFLLSITEMNRIAAVYN